MSKSKRYYWIKLPKDYFNDIVQKKMRKQQQGLLYQIIYLKLMLLSCNNEGIIEFKGVYDTLYEEISENIFENEEIVKEALYYFEKNNLLEYMERDIYIPQTICLTGSEADSAERVRKHRATTKQEVLQSNGEALQSNINVTKCNTEIEKEIDNKIKIENKIDSKIDTTSNPNNAKQSMLYGVYKNITLTNAEYSTLCDKYTQRITDEYIEIMSNHIKKKNGKGYGDKSFFHLCSWIDEHYTKEQIQEEKEKQKSISELEEINKKACGTKNDL